MKKVIGLALLFILAVSVLPSFAAENARETALVDAGNKLCPVSGDPVSGKDFVAYQGKRYGLCCPMCEKPFLADPEKYLAAMKSGAPAAGMEMNLQRTASPQAPSTSGDAKSDEMEKDMEQGSL